MRHRVQKKWTLEELHSLPDDGNKYELIHGELFVTPASKLYHEFILARLSRLLDPYGEANGLGYVFRARAIIAIDDESEVEPDLMVRHVPASPDAGWSEAPLPILVVEVASDSTRRRDRVHKRGIYGEAGIPEYWIVDGDDRTVRIVRLEQDDLITRHTLTWHPSGAETPLLVDLGNVFWPA